MNLSYEYKFVLEKHNWANNSFHQNEFLNSFLIVLEVFNSIKTKGDFKHFRNNFPPEWIYIPAVRLKNKMLFLQVWKYIYYYHFDNDNNFDKKQTLKNYLNHLNYIYEDIILNWWLEYNSWMDMSVTFCKEPLIDILKKYCSKDEITRYNKWIDIHTIEVYWSINKVLFFRATRENKLNEKIIDIYEEWKNTKRICKDFLKYYYEKTKHIHQ